MCRVLDYRFAEPLLLQQALTHRSADAVNNERLEFLGDAILGLVIADLLYQRFPDIGEGMLSRARATLVKGETLAMLARQLALGDYMILGSGELKSGGHRRDSILAGMLEAIIGAIYIDGGIEPARHVIGGLYRVTLQDFSADDITKDPKTRLQEYLQARQLPLPQYEVTAISGYEHEQMFSVQCRIAGIAGAGAGQGGNRRRAEQQAAQQMLEILMQQQNGG
ncbi:MAG: ribonuclease III [Gammaproteobacteria bacterium]|nr:ribonuclease III [Gammaproteobacteria bacterium]